MVSEDSPLSIDDDFEMMLTDVGEAVDRLSEADEVDTIGVELGVMVARVSVADVGDRVEMVTPDFEDDDGREEVSEASEGIPDETSRELLLISVGDWSSDDTSVGIGSKNT